MAPDMISSSHCRPRAMDLSRRALRSALIGRTCPRETEAGKRSSRAFLNGGLHQGISNGVALVSTADAENVPSQSRLLGSDGGGLSQTANWFLWISMRETDDAMSRSTRFFATANSGDRCVLSAMMTAASMSAAGTRVIAPGGGVASPRRYGCDT